VLILLNKKILLQQISLKIYVIALRPLNKEILLQQISLKIYVVDFVT
jgi:hypothetical protein